MRTFKLAKKTKTLGVLSAAVLSGFLTGCDDASVASANLSWAADNFEIARRVVFYNGITGDYILTVQGLCSVSTDTLSVSFTCKDDEGKYVKHMLGLSDNVTYFSEQLSAHKASTYQYRVTFKPDVVIPDFKLRSKLVEDVNKN